MVSRSLPGAEAVFISPLQDGQGRGSTVSVRAQRARGMAAAGGYFSSPSAHLGRKVEKRTCEQAQPLFIPLHLTIGHLPSIVPDGGGEFSQR